MTAENSLEALVKGIKHLPALPNNIEKINAIIGRDHMALTDVGREIAADQALSAQVLRLINSSFYGMSQPISSIPHAVVLLGVKTIRILISTSFASGLIEKSIPGLYDHSLACARTCGLLATTLGLEDPEIMTTIGLLHDIGKVILAENLPEHFEQIKKAAQNENITFVEAEKSLFGATHGDVGAWLLSKWNLPASTIGAIQHHHASDVPEEHMRSCSILKLADLIVRAGSFGWPGDNKLPSIPDSAAECLNLSPEEISSITHKVLINLNDIPRYPERVIK